MVGLEPGGLELPLTSVPATADEPIASLWNATKPIVVPVPPEGELHPVLEIARSQGLRATCWLPLMAAHRRLGVLIFGRRSSTPGFDDSVDVMEQLAPGLALAVDNGINREEAHGYYRELQAERDRHRFLLDVNNLLLSQLDYPAVLKAICEAIQRVFDADHIGLALYDPERGELRLHMLYEKNRGITHQARRSDPALDPDNSAAGVTFQRGIPGVFERSQLEALEWTGASVMNDAGIESMCCVPLVTRTARLGALYVGSVRRDPFTEDVVALLGQTSNLIAIAVENARAYQRVVTLNAQLTDQNHYLEVELQNEFKEIVGNSPALRRILKAVETVAPTDSTALLLGETGTGKELIARAIHNLSPRRDRTFVRMNVAAFPQGLIESELFGHEKGAFTGALAGRVGRLELANRGTLFLDEVGDIPQDMQPKLLRVLQEREFERLGSTRTQHVDVRIVAATHRDLERMVDDGSFRSDLYYRLNVFPITVPPLRDRIEDIPALARHFAAQSAARLGRPVPDIPEAAITALQEWSWPGNVRELQNVIERAVIVSGATLVLSRQDIQPKARLSVVKAKTLPMPTFKDAERETILRALRESRGVIAGPAGAAARLGLQRTTLQSKMRKLGIRRPSF
jgi:formate hydrogenlyase transcriptional activator